MTTISTVETLDGLTAVEREVILTLANATNYTASLEQAFEVLTRTIEIYKAGATFGPDWFVYRGGSHIAVHDTYGGPRRLFVRERRIANGGR